MHEQFLSRSWQQPRDHEFGGINMKPGNNVYLSQEKHLCWQLERKGLESRKKTFNASHVRTKPPLCVGAFRVSEPYHRQRAHVLDNNTEKRRCKTRGSHLASFKRPMQTSNTFENVLSTCAAGPRRWTPMVHDMLTGHALMIVSRCDDCLLIPLAKLRHEIILRQHSVN